MTLPFPLVAGATTRQTTKERLTKPWFLLGPTKPWGVFQQLGGLTGRTLFSKLSFTTSFQSSLQLSLHDSLLQFLFGTRKVESTEQQPLTMPFSLSDGCLFHPSFISTVSRAKFDAQNKDQSLETRLELKQLIVNLVNLRIWQTGEQPDPRSKAHSKLGLRAVPSIGNE